MRGQDPESVVLRLRRECSIRSVLNNRKRETRSELVTPLTSEATKFSCRTQNMASRSVAFTLPPSDLRRRGRHRRRLFCSRPRWSAPDPDRREGPGERGDAAPMQTFGCVAWARDALQEPSRPSWYLTRTRKSATPCSLTHRRVATLRSATDGVPAPPDLRAGACRPSVAS